MRIEELRGATAEELARVWNASWAVSGTNPYPLHARLWRARSGAAGVAPPLVFAAHAGGEAVGFAAGRLGERSWGEAGVGFVTLIAVAAPWQGAGVGGRLLDALLARLSEAGGTTVRVGGGPGHLFPGVPQEAPLAAWRLLRRRGVRFERAYHDLHLDLRAPLPAAPLPPGWRVRSDQESRALDFIAVVFPGRWAHEAAAYAATGAELLTLERTAAPAGQRVAGFCLLFPASGPLGPSISWSGVEGAAPAGAYGMGPLGVAPSVRGGGLGLAFVRAAAAHARERGAEELIIDWTDLEAFYGRLGARVLRTYQAAEGALGEGALYRNRNG